MLHPPNAPNRETQIPQYEFKINPKSQVGFATQETEKSEVCRLGGHRGLAFCVETVTYITTSTHLHLWTFSYTRKHTCLSNWDVRYAVSRIHTHSHMQKFVSTHYINISTSTQM